MFIPIMQPPFGRFCKKIFRVLRMSRFLPAHFAVSALQTASFRGEATLRYRLALPAPAALEKNFAKNSAW